MKEVKQKSGANAQLGRITKKTMAVVAERSRSIIRNSSFVILSAALLLCVSCKKNEKEKDTTVPVESVEVSPATLTMVIGETKTLSATVEPEKANQDVEWSVTASAPDGVVTVNKKTGEVTAIKAGTATVTATAGDETAKCKITVTDPEPDPSTIDDGVLINGVIWATRNIDAPGHFAETPESAGMFYQWNINIGWSSTDPMINSNGGTTWDNTPPTGSSWTAANDPSPAGWRVPTQAELETLSETDKVSVKWTTKNGVIGNLYTDIATGKTLFLPFTDLRSDDDGHLSTGDFSYYWSSTKHSTWGPYALAFEVGDYTTYVFNSIYNDGFSVRCAKK